MKKLVVLAVCTISIPFTVLAKSSLLDDALNTTLSEKKVVQRQYKDSYRGQKIEIRDQKDPIAVEFSDDSAGTSSHGKEVGFRYYSNEASDHGIHEEARLARDVSKTK